MRYGNGVTNRYVYDSLNRLTNAVWKLNAGTLASFSYQLGLTGNRTNLNEMVGGTNRAYGWQYDNLYRLADEAMTNNGLSAGNLAYQFDLVGNRTARNSTVSGLANQTFAYNTNDWLKTDAYDNDGNTLWSTNGTVQGPYSYDALNHLTNANGILMTYDGDGNRVSETVSGTTTYYLVDDRNPSGYPQVLEEYQAVWTTYTWAGPSTLSRAYNYGTSLISQQQFNTNTLAPSVLSYYGYDGHGNVRFLMNTNGGITDTYKFDAFGNLIASDGTTPNDYLYSGQQYDSDLGLYDNRARYLNTDIGRFMTMDTFEGNNEDPLSLHKYLYAEDDPVNMEDPSGNDADGGFSVSDNFNINISSIGGLLAKIGTPVTSETGLGVFGSDLVLLEAHPVAFGNNHSYITLMVNSSSVFFSEPQFNHLAGGGNLHYATIGAGPSGVGIDSKLISGVDRPRDVDRSTRIFSTEIQPPGGLTADQFIQMLLNLNALYDDQADYIFFPNEDPISDPTDTAYNSNSYASGLLKLATGQVPPYELYKPTIAPAVPMKIKRWNSFSATNAS